MRGDGGRCEAPAMAGGCADRRCRRLAGPAEGQDDLSGRGGRGDFDVLRV